MTERLLPLYWRPLASGSRNTKGVQRLLDALGPAAITALLVVSLWPAWRGDGSAAASAAAGLVAVALAHRWRGGLAWPTLAGVVGYGLVRWLGA